MERCQTIEDGVRAVLKIYNITEPDWALIPGDLCDTLRVGDKTVPLFWWRTDTQVAQMIRLAPPRKLCSMKLNRTYTKAEGLERLLYRELDVAEACLGASVKKIMCYKREHSLIMLATMANERVAIFELAAVLHEDTPEQGRHTYYKRNHSRRYHRLANDIYLASLTLHSLCYRLLRRRTQYRASLLRRLIVRHLQLSLRN
jgi:hypothetical protein